MLSIYAAYAITIPPSATFRPAALVLLAAASGWAVLALVVRDRHRAALAASWTVFMFWAYGFAFLLVNDVLLPSLGIRNRYLGVAWALIYGAVMWRIVGRGGSPERSTRILNRVGLAALAVPLAAAVLSTAANRLSSGPAADMELPPAVRVEPPQHPPDIYWVVLDGYGRADVLANGGYGITRTLADVLPGHGFYVADQSRTNYPTTLHSLSSTLNLDYHHRWFADRDVESVDYGAFRRLVRQSVIRRTLAPLGYKFVAYASGYRYTEIPDADVYIRPPASLSRLETLVFNKTVLRSLPQSIFDLSPYSIHRRRVLGCFESLPRIADDEAPKFVYAHMVVPHQPWVFDARGNTVNNRDRSFLWAEKWWSAGLDLPEGSLDPGYVEGYAAQLAFINGIVERAVVGMIERSARPPIIIVQGDHGPHGWREVPVGVRFPILNAYYLPDGGEEDLYPSITPVNSFRVVLNRYFGADLPLLPDESYQCTYLRPFEFEKLDPEEWKPRPPHPPQVGDP